MALLLLVAAGVSGLALGQMVDAGAILAIVALNAVIALVEEGRASRALEALRAMVAPTATTVRDGQTGHVPASALVRDDVVVLGAGDRVPADIEMTDGAVEVDEALLTGESLPVARAAGGDRVLSAGTFVVRGAGTGRVTATGPRTRLGAIALQIEETAESTPLQRELAGVTGKLAAAAVVVAVAVFAVTALRFDNTEAFLAAVALAVAAVPEGLATVTALGLAMGVRRMAGRGAVIRRLPAVETLGCTTVVVTDKTGTLTEGRMAVSAIALPGSAPVPPNELAPAARARVGEVALGCNAASLDPPTGDALDLALLVGLTGQVGPVAPALAVLPFDAERDRMTTLHGNEDAWVVLMKGAPEAVVGRCASATAADGTTVPLDGEAKDAVLAQADAMAGAGARVIAMARRGGDGPLPELPAVEADLSLVGLVAMGDPLRPAAADAVGEARRAGVEVVMATGDHLATATHVARAVGIDAVHARVDPADKLRLVQGLQAEGHVVAVTGDGVNDAPALRQADIGIAMGRGSEVARNAADMVLTDDNLATIVAAIAEGRRIYDRLHRVIQYLIAGNLSEITVVIGALALFPAVGAPLLPVQLLWINLLTDGAPALALGTAATDEAVMRRRPRGRGEHLLAVDHVPVLVGRGLLLAGGSLGAMAVVHHGLGRPFATTRTVGFATLVLAHLLYAVVVAAPSTGWRRPDRAVTAAVVGSLGLQAMVLLSPWRSVLHTVWLTPAEWVTIVVAGSLPPFALWAASRRHSGPSARHDRA